MASAAAKKSAESNASPLFLPLDAFKGKIVLVTGGTEGIGAETAIQFTKYGARVAIVGRNKQRLINVARQCATRPVCLQADLTNDKELECVARTCLERFSGIDVLVNAAGIKREGSLLTSTLAQYDEVMNLNLRAMFYLTHLLAPALIKNKGSIVNVSSTLAVRPAAGVLPYCISKACVDKLTQSIALDLAPKGVRCNSVSPGIIDMQMQFRHGMDQMSSSEYLEKIKHTLALKRLGKIHEVTSAIIFLASPASGYVTGTALAVDGGRHIKCPI